MLLYVAWLILALPILISILVPLVAYLREKTAIYLAIATCIILTVLSISIIPEVFFNAPEGYHLIVPWITALNINLGIFIDPLGAMFTFLTSFIGLITAIYSLGYMTGEEGLARYYFFLLLSIGGMIGLVLSDNLLQLFIFWEIIGLSSYLLISFWYKRPETVRSATKVFLMMRIGDVFLLAGICMLYVYSGSFSLTILSSSLERIPTLSVFLMLIGAIAKSAQVPFHTWLYNAMEAPTPANALLDSTTAVKAGVYLIARLIHLFGASSLLTPMWHSSIMWIGIITALIGGMLALVTTDIKGVAAYSTSSQIGLMLVALGTVQTVFSFGWFAFISHLLSHAFFQALDFLLIGGVERATKTRDMRLMGGLRKAMPITFVLSIIVLLARTGIPPLKSFFSKKLILKNVMLFGGLDIVFLLYIVKALTCAYALRAIILIYMRKRSDHIAQFHVRDPPKIMLLPSVVLAALCVALVLFGDAIANFMRVDVEISMSDILSSLTLLSLSASVIGGLKVYLAYYRKVALIEYTRKSLLKVLELISILDLIYEKTIVKATLFISSIITYIEEKFLWSIPSLFANKFMIFSRLFYKYIEVEHIEHYVVITLIGLLLISSLIIVILYLR